MMGVYGNGDDKPRRKARKADNSKGNLSKLASLKAKRTAFDLDVINTAQMLEVLFMAMSEGGALRLGLTRDGGAMAVGVYIDGASETVYLNEGDDQEKFWQTLYDLFREGA